MSLPPNEPPAGADPSEFGTLFARPAAGSAKKAAAGPAKPVGRPRTAVAEPGRMTGADVRATLKNATAEREVADAPEKARTLKIIDDYYTHMGERITRKRRALNASNTLTEIKMELHMIQHELDGEGKFVWAEMLYYDALGMIESLAGDRLPMLRDILKQKDPVIKRYITQLVILYGSRFEMGPEKGLALVTAQGIYTSFQIGQDPQARAQFVRSMARPASAVNAKFADL